METDTTKQSGTFVNTRMKSLFVAQDEKPATLREINFARLTPFQRGLIVTDGTVTRFIEAYTLAPVEVVLLQQKNRPYPVIMTGCNCLLEKKLSHDR